MKPKLPGMVPPEIPAMPASSRYHGVEIAEQVGPDGETIRFLRRRFLPRDPPVGERAVTVPPHARADRLAQRLVGDPEAWWRLADVNGVTRAEQLEEEGRVLQLPGDDS